MRDQGGACRSMERATSGIYRAEAEPLSIA
jgi:hypothetical protein